jgi:quercetin dioxygenase-like cupin family protein
MEIRRFGIGHRRSEGPAGTVGVSAAPVHADKLGVIAELALRPNASIAPHSNPNLTYLIVIEGGGFVRIGDETARVAAGEAVVWPPDVVHAAWTEATPMRAIVVEFTLRGDDRGPLLIVAEAGGVDQAAPTAVPAAGPDAAKANAETEPPTPDARRAPASRADGSLASKPEPVPGRRVSPDGEPW